MRKPLLCEAARRGIGTSPVQYECGSGRTEAWGVTAGSEVCDTIQEIMRKADMGISVSRAVWGSDSNSFAWKGIPASTMDRDGFGMHTRYDTIDLISPEALESGARMLGWIAWTLAMADEMPFAREVPEEFVQQLESAFGKR